MSTRFQKQYPDFASIEHYIRQAHAERQLAIATGIADGITAAVRAIGRLFGAATSPKSALSVKAAAVARRAT